MASHVRMLTIRPDDQVPTDGTRRKVNGIMSPRIAARSAQSDPPARVPESLRYPLAIITTLTLSSLFYSLVAGLTGPELASVSRNLTSGWHIGAMLAWKLSELSIAWYACYDYLDLAYLTLLNQVPHYFLLNTFYGIDYFAALIPLIIDVASVSIPFALFRGLDSGHQNVTKKTANQQVAQDGAVQYLTALFGAALYALVVYGSFQTWLPVYMVTHFDGVRSLDKVHSTVLPLLFGLFGPLGFAATQFIFVPAIGSAANPGITDPKIHPEKTHFDPETASFAETVFYNLGLSKSGFTPRVAIIAKRTAILAAYTFINAFVRSYVTVEGTELLGALGWASVWASAAGLTGLAYTWVGDE